MMTETAFWNYLPNSWLRIICIPALFKVEHFGCRPKWEFWRAKKRFPHPSPTISNHVKLAIPPLNLLQRKKNLPSPIPFDKKTFWYKFIAPFSTSLPSPHPPTLPPPICIFCWNWIVVLYMQNYVWSCTCKIWEKVEVSRQYKLHEKFYQVSHTKTRTKNDLSARKTELWDWIAVKFL